MIFFLLRLLLFYFYFLFLVNYLIIENFHIKKKKIHKIHKETLYQGFLSFSNFRFFSIILCFIILFFCILKKSINNFLKIKKYIYSKKEFLILFFVIIKLKLISGCE